MEAADHTVGHEFREVVNSGAVAWLVGTKRFGRASARDVVMHAGAVSHGTDEKAAAAAVEDAEYVDAVDGDV